MENLVNSILVVDDEESVLSLLEATLTKMGYKITTARDGFEALDQIKEKLFDVIVLDLKMPKMDGLDVLHAVKEINPDLLVIIMTAYGSIRTAVDAMKEGAYDYFTKPFDLDEMRIVVKKAVDTQQLKKENKYLQERLEKRFGFGNIIGVSEKIQRVYALMERVIASDVTVLLKGETGTGKELVARTIHYNSARKKGPYIRINCAAIPESLLESELFGHEKGSFTGASTQREGKFESGHQGTVFLDEIGDMSLATQAKILRVLQEYEFERVGGKETIKVDVRIIAATNKDLLKAIEQKKFRQDLYYRLNVVPIFLPPLRERREDIPLLAEHFLKEASQETQKKIEKISPQAMKRLIEYDWPGNIRELRNVIQRAIILSDGESILPDLLFFESELGDIDQRKRGQKEVFPLEKRLVEEERKFITQALEKSGGVQTKAAKLLGLGRGSLQYRMQKLGIKFQK